MIFNHSDFEKIADFEKKLKAAMKEDDIQEIAELVFEIKELGYHKNGGIDISEAEKKLYGDD